MRITPTILNAALQSYVRTFPMRTHLFEHIEHNGLVDQKAEIQTELDAVLKTAEDHLYSYPGGVPKTESFQTEFKALILGKHPWLDPESLGRIQGFSGWLCWHEGLHSP